jgi:hypothetical protein
MTTSTSDPHGVSVLPASYLAKFEVPTDSGVGSTRDMGALALFLVANWFVNGETVLIDGGVRLRFFSFRLLFEAPCPAFPSLPPHGNFYCVSFLAFLIPFPILLPFMDMI